MLALSVCSIALLSANASTQSAGVLLAADLESHQVLALSLDAPGQIKPFTSGAAMDFLSDMVFGPDGHVYVMEGNYESGTNRVLRFNGSTGAFMNVFADLGPEGWNGGITFGPDGSLYVASWWYDAIRKFDGTTGQFLSYILVVPGTDFYSIATGPDGFLYVPGDCSSGGVFTRFAPDGSNLSFLPAQGGANGPRKPVWGPDGNFYSANLNDGVVRRYSGSTGAFIDVFADPPEYGSVALAFGGDGHLYISGVWNKTVFRADGTNGAYLGILASGVCVESLLPVPPPVLLRQPISQIACERGTVTFQAEVRSPLLSALQWHVNGTPIPGATNSTLRLTSLTTNHAGDYTIRASNIGGSVVSSAGHLTVRPPARLEITISYFFDPYPVLRVDDESAAIYAVESSTDLKTWELVTLTSRGATVPDYRTGWGPRCFYRARLLE